MSTAATAVSETPRRDSSAASAAAPGSGFRADPNRYHLYVCFACPRSLRAVVTRDLRGLEDAVTVSAVDPVRDGRGWRVPARRRARAGHRGRVRVPARGVRGDGVPLRRPGVGVPALWDRWSAA
ncbi:hypothetical protein ACU686_05790 [Yinghuangia aomiensis]